MNFLQDASDRFEIMCRDPKDPNLLNLEKDAINIVGPDWHARLDRAFTENLGKFRKYDGKSVQDLLRALRNKVSCHLTLKLNADLRVAVETPLPRSSRKRKTQSWAHARWIPGILHT